MSYSFGPRSRSQSKFAALAVLFILLFSVIFGLAAAETLNGPMVITTFEDVTDYDDGLCSLREAVIVMNRQRALGRVPGECQPISGTNTILLPPGLYQLTKTSPTLESKAYHGDLDILKSVIIKAQEPGLVVIHAAYDNDRVFEVHNRRTAMFSGLTISGGNAADYGGGIYSRGYLTLENVTLTGNSAAVKGGGLYSRLEATLINVTITGNEAPAGSGLHASIGAAGIVNSMIVGDSCSGDMQASGSADGNLQWQAPECSLDIFGTMANPQLEPQEIAGLPGTAVLFGIPATSPAVGAADSAFCPDVDQIGTERPPGENCDIGAVESAPGNLPPVAADDEATTPEDTAVNIDVQENDSAGPANEDQALTTTSVTLPANGSATVEADGTVTYDPAPDYYGSDSFEYEVCDSESLCSTAAVAITITADSYIEVKNTNDAGAGSLREAILEANSLALPGTIIFDIEPEPCAPATINLTQVLPVISSQVTIDGLLQENGACSTGHITLDGGSDSFSGLRIAASAAGSTVRDLTIQNFGNDGIFLQGAGAPGLGSVIQGNTISNNGRNGVAIGNDVAAADGNSVLGNTISGNCGSGVLIFGLGAASGFDQNAILGNLIQDNTISDNGSCSLTVDGTPGGVALNDGITIADGLNNEIVGNNIFGNTDLNVDLGGDGPTPNDIDDPDAGANYQQNYPVLLSATPGTSAASGQTGNEITGYLNSVPSNDFSLQFFVSDSCNGDGLLNTPLNVVFTLPPDAAGSMISTDNEGNIPFSVTVLGETLDYGQFVTSIASDAAGNSSEYSECIDVDDNNVVWPLGWELDSGDVVSQKLTQIGQSRWYRFWVEPNSRFKIKLEMPPGLVENYDLVVYNDILSAYAELLGDANVDIDQLDAEFPNDAFAPSLYSPSLYSPSLYSPSLYSPSLYSPSLYSPSLYSPSLYSPDVYSPSLYSPSLYSPSLYSPSLYSPSLYSPSLYSASEVDGNAYSAAQMSSLVAVSGNDGQLPEELNLSSYNNGGYYYARVRGRQGGFDPNIDFTLGLTIEDGVCENILAEFASLADSDPVATAGGFETVILVDWARMNLDAADQAALASKLEQLAADPTVSGVIVDVGADPDVVQRNALADRFDDEDGSGDFYRICPYAKNIVADGVKEIVDAYRDLNPIKYVVIVGDDDDIPFYRIPDQSGLGPEEDYVVPTQADSASYASLRNNYFLSQDGYGSKLGVAVKNDTLPVPDVGVGRLVETSDEIIKVIDAYLSEPVMVPQNALVTAYDFLSDGGIGVRDTLAGSLSQANVNDDLLAEGQQTWTAEQLANTLNAQDFDIAFLSGHFSANSTLAADFETYYLTTDFAQTPDDYFYNALFYSAGCHSGYNIVNEHSIPNYTIEPDWAAAMARKGATLIAGTGYQYGDTDFVEYSERLYLEFTRQLRAGQPGEAIAIGDAFVKAKQGYLADTPNMRGIHQKALLEATIFGLPMKSVNMPGARLDLSSSGPGLSEGDLTLVNDNPAVATEPGETLGLHYFDLNRAYNLTEVPNPLYDVEDLNQTNPIAVSYLEGPDGVVVNPGEPVLPLDSFNATVASSNKVLQGVGFLGGSYKDFAGKIPLVAAATTEESAIHFDFLSFVFYAQQLFTINRYDALIEEDGRTQLNLFPAQYKTEQPDPPSSLQTATQRQFQNLQLRLFYIAEDFMQSIDSGSNRPDLSAAPTIVRVDGEALHNVETGLYDVNFLVQAVVDPSAGMQQVWVTHTDASSPTAAGNSGTWHSIFLEQDAADTTLWRGTLPNVSDPRNIRYIAQAASGTGLVTMSNNLGRFYIPGGNLIPTTLVQMPPVPTQGAVGTTVTFSAELTDENGGALADMPVLFDVGQDSRLGWTDGAGEVTVDITLIATSPLQLPGTNQYDAYDVTITFPGSVLYAASTAETGSFTVLPQDTAVTLDPAVVSVSSLQPDVAIYAQLQDIAGQPLTEKTVTFTVTDTENSSVSFQKAVITGPDGRARLGQVNLPATGEYSVQARFDGTSSYNPSAAPGSSIITSNRAPVCDNVVVKTWNGKPNIWSANNKLVGLKLSGATDPDGDALTYSFLKIYQDEMLGGDLDGTITNGCSDAEARAQRDGNGNGRVYHVFYQVDDGNGGTCSGEALIGVSHDQGDPRSYDEGALVNSLGDGVAMCSP